jgi:AAA+ ATPase superfamily predicted ATPase
MQVVFMKIVNSQDIFNKEKCSKIVNELTSSGKNILIFGMHNSGKSTLVKAACKTDKRFKTLEEEEVLSDKDGLKLLKKSKKLWCVGHQYPGQSQDATKDYLTGFAEGMGLKLKDWVIVKIIK